MSRSLSFVAGALSASVVWAAAGWAARHIIYFTLHQHRRPRLESVGDDSDDGSRSGNSDEVDGDDNITRSFAKWPWDKIRKRVLDVSASFLNLDLGEAEENVSVTANDKTGLCIGEIFGLDVGGTLTKLVYFEQQVAEIKRQNGLHRKEHYNAAASALEVLQARLSESMNEVPHNSESDNDLQGLWRLRQESVPDRLDEYTSSNNVGAPLSPGREESEIDSPNRTGSGMKKSKSMVNMSKSTERAELLDNFYSFARRLDTYETAVKDKHLSYYSRSLNGTFHFIRFETRRMDNAMNLMRFNNFHLNIKEIGATGGGAHKYHDDWDRELGIIMAKQDEMDSLVAGMQFVMADIVGECYTFKPNDWSPRSPPKHESAVNGSLKKTPQQLPMKEVSFPEIKLPSDSSIEDVNLPGKESMRRGDSENSETNRPRVDTWWTSKKVGVDTITNLYPYLVVSIGTGVSILRVDGPRKQERISGSTIGGGTYWGLCRLLTGSDSFSDVLDLAMKGDPSKVDMMVGDIYGKDSNALEKIGLPSDIVASSFGKLVAKPNPSDGIKEEDLARALLLMVTNNIGQVAHLNARLHKTQRIFFVGTFLQHNIISQQRLAYSIDYWSQGKMEAQFLNHEGYFGALGAFLLNQGIEHESLRHNGKGTDTKKNKKKKAKLHKRSKSLDSMPPFPSS